MAVLAEFPAAYVTRRCDMFASFVQKPVVSFHLTMPDHTMLYGTIPYHTIPWYLAMWPESGLPGETCPQHNLEAPLSFSKNLFTDAADRIAEARQGWGLGRGLVLDLALGLWATG